PPLAWRTRECCAASGVCDSVRGRVDSEIKSICYASRLPARAFSICRGGGSRIGYTLCPDARPKVLICVQVCPEKQRPKAKVAELVDALDLGSSGETRES